jgi:hypothetical protein
MKGLKMESSTRQDDVLNWILGQPPKVEMTPERWLAVVLKIHTKLQPKLKYMPLDEPSRASESYPVIGVKGDARSAFVNPPWGENPPRKLLRCTWKTGRGEHDSEWIRLFLDERGRWLLSSMILSGYTPFGRGSTYDRVRSSNVSVLDEQGLLLLFKRFEDFPRETANAIYRLYARAIETRKHRLRNLIREQTEIFEIRQAVGEHLVDTDRPNWSLDVISWFDLPR